MLFRSYQSGFIQQLDKLSLRCSICQGAYKPHAWCMRKARTGSGVCHLRVLRVKCAGCNGTHLVLPDFLRPYGRYTQHVRQKAILACLAGVAAEKAAICGQAAETIRRWIARFKADLEEASAALRSLLARHGRFEPPGRGSPLRRLARVRAQVVSAFGGRPAHSCLLGLANILLTQVDLPVWV